VTEERLISIVDDDASLRRGLVSLVRSLGYAASGHVSAEDFLATGEAERTDCVITDLQMPGMGGIELKLRLDRQAPAVPVIMITARSEPALLDRARSSGAACLLRKPFQHDAFLACLERALAH
jgi:FixJ family two-component response regulator